MNNTSPATSTPTKSAKKPLTRRARIARIRFVVMISSGLVAGLLTGYLDTWRHAPAAGWAVAAGVYVFWMWSTISPMDAAATASHANEEDPRRQLGNFLTTLCALASLVAVGIVMVDAQDASTGTSRLGLGALAIGTTTLSWMMMHILYTLRYAEVYYTSDPPRGVDFNQPELPKYTDFAYVSLGFGIVYCVSDTDITSSAFREVTLRHALLSWVFGTGILATTINLVVSLASGK